MTVGNRYLESVTLKNIEVVKPFPDTNKTDRTQQ